MGSHFQFRGRGKKLCQFCREPDVYGRTLPLVATQAQR